MNFNIIITWRVCNLSCAYIHTVFFTYVCVLSANLSLHFVKYMEHPSSLHINRKTINLINDLG